MLSKPMRLHQRSDLNQQIQKTVLRAKRSYGKLLVLPLEHTAILLLLEHYTFTKVWAHLHISTPLMSSENFENIPY